LRLTHPDVCFAKSGSSLSIKDGEGRIRKYCLLLEEEKGDRERSEWWMRRKGKIIC
jgi:hypothetical protein